MEYQKWGLCPRLVHKYSFGNGNSQKARGTCCSSSWNGMLLQLSRLHALSVWAHATGVCKWRGTWFWMTTVIEPSKFYKYAGLPGQAQCKEKGWEMCVWFSGGDKARGALSTRGVCAWTRGFVSWVTERRAALQLARAAWNHLSPLRHPERLGPCQR